MIFHRENETIIRQASGTLWHFYYTDHTGIQYKTLSGDGSWSYPETLAEEGMKDFSVNIDPQDRIHLIYQTIEGELKYMRYNGRSWNSQLLSTYEPQKYIIRHPTLITINNKLHIIFALGAAFNVGLWSLHHYYWNGSAWSQYEVCNITAGKHISPFQIDVDHDDLCLVYRAMDNNTYQIYYTRFAADHALWTNQEKISNNTSDAAYPSILIQENGSISFVWTSIYNSNMHVHYLKKTPYQSRGIQRQGRLLSSGNANCTHPFITEVENQLWVLWYQNEQIRMAMSDDSGESWTEPDQVPQNEFKEIYLYRYLSNVSVEKGAFHTNYILGNIDGSPTVILLDPYIKLSIKPEDPPAELYQETIDKNEEITEESETSNKADPLVEKAEKGPDSIEPAASVSENTSTPISASAPAAEKTVEKPDSIKSTASAPPSAPVSKNIYQEGNHEYLAELLEEIGHITSIKVKLEEVLNHLDKSEDKNTTLHSLDKRLQEWESLFISLQKQTDDALERIRKNEAEILQISASLQNLEKEYLDIVSHISRYKEKNLLKRIFSSLKGF